MRQKEHETRNAMKVWLSELETAHVIDSAESTKHEIAFRLMARCGLRRSEVVDVSPEDLTRSEEGTAYLRIPDGKSGYRETPLSDTLEAQLQALAELEGREPGDSVLDVSDRTVSRWLKGTCETVAEELTEPAWKNVNCHDLRRSWGTNLLADGVLPSVVMSWGGWEDWDTFREHYLGEFSPKALERERSKVAYLTGVAEAPQDSDGFQRDEYTTSPS